MTENLGYIRYKDNNLVKNETSIICMKDVTYSKVIKLYVSYRQFNRTTLLANSADDKLMIFFLFSPESTL